ncbi:MAG: hypothetical protein KIS96_10495 [Bauldia sp.]|nr:hypothetical protein [Bauldia sp.]
MSIKRSLAILAAPALLLSPALAQGGADDEIRAIVAAWVAEESGNDVPAVVQSFATACFSDLIIALPEEARATFLGEDTFVDRMDAIVETHPEFNVSVRVDFQNCGETVVLGLDAYAWVSTTLIDAPVEEVDTMTACYLEAIHPLPSAAKEFIYNAETFAIGAADLIANQPEEAGDLAERMNTCGWSATVDPDSGSSAEEPAG